MRRFVTLAVLLLFTIPFGVSISGCSKKSPTIYCSGADSGIPVGQVTTITTLNASAIWVSMKDSPLTVDTVVPAQ